MSTEDFTLANLPFGVADGRVHVAFGDRAVDLARAAAADVVELPVAALGGPLNNLMALGRERWRALRDHVRELLLTGDLEPFMVDRSSLVMELPVAVGDFVDGYAGIHHATNLGRILRPGTEPLNPNYRHLPVMYHGRSGTIVPSGTVVRRPRGPVLVDDVPQLQPTSRLDVELELGVVVGAASDHGEPIPVERAHEHVFGYVLVNDWSARDIQSFEYVPLGPFLGKSFATSISCWVVTTDALDPFLAPAIPQDPPPLEYLRDDHRVPDLTLTLEVNGERVSEVSLASSLYWTPAQQLAHLTVNGASVRCGDLLATGTISGGDPVTQAGSLVERGGAFLADGDEVVMRAWAGEGDHRVGFGELRGSIAS